MKRMPIIAGNWKMNTTAESAVELCRGVRELSEAIADIEKVVCPPFLFLSLAAQELRGSSIRVGAQNVHWEEKGAYTGEVSTSMLRGAVEFVIVGHSERRAYFCETDETVNKKVRAVLTAGLRPIMCVGETESEREGGQTEAVLVRQVRGGLRDIDLPEGFAIAYEPVWAIGTGKAASGALANETIDLIRSQVRNLFGAGKAQSLRVLYGGSVTADNIAEFISEPEIDGALVGGACLKADSFASIIEQSAQISSNKK